MNIKFGYYINIPIFTYILFVYQEKLKK